AEALDRALSRAQHGAAPFFPEDTLRLALDVLAKMTAAPEGVVPAHAQLAVSIITHFRRPATRTELRTALDAALRMHGQPQSDADRRSQALANALAEVAPGELLRYPPDCECVQSALRALAVQRGWLVFGN